MRDRPRHRNRLGDLADQNLIAKLTEWLEKSGARELEIETADGQALAIILGKSSRTSKIEVAALTINAPMAGCFQPVPHLACGSAVAAGDILGLIEIGPLRLPVPAPESGVLRDIHGEAGRLIGYGAPLFVLEPTA